VKVRRSARADLPIALASRRERRAAHEREYFEFESDQDEQVVGEKDWEMTYKDCREYGMSYVSFVDCER
jgi:hypothetical protein